MSILSNRLTELMYQKGMTQTELAHETGISQAAISRYIKQNRIPHNKNLYLLAMALDTDINYLLGVTAPTDDIIDDMDYLRRNLAKLNNNQLRRAKIILQNTFINIFDNDENIKKGD